MILPRRQGEKYALHEKHLNTQLVRVLKTLGYDVNFARGEGPHLYDVAGRRYLDLLSGFGVFALGRNHPAIAAALRQVLEAQLPGLVQLDVSRSEEHTSELQSLMRISYAVFCLKTKNKIKQTTTI